MGACLSHPNSNDSPSSSPARQNNSNSARPPPAVTSGSAAHTRASGSTNTPSKGKGKATTSAQARRSRSSSGPLDPDSIEMSSAAVLRTYATLPSPSTSLPPRVLLSHNASTLAIFDAYPKAKYHFLVLPRYPFPSNNDPESTRSICRLSDLDDLRSLLTKTTRDAREQIVGQMAEMAREVEEMIRDEMVKSEGWEWRIDVGFHAIPSLKHLHLHVISDDRLSPALKTKKHYNSFRPDLGFFVSIADVQRWILDDDDTIRERVDALLGTHSLLASPLTCFKCDEPHHNIPKLKTHLEKEFKEEGRKALARIKKTGRQRTSSEEDMF